MRKAFFIHKKENMKIGINGFGRIGRSFFRIAMNNGLNIIAINDVHGAKDAAYLLKYDSVYGKYDKEVKVVGNNIEVDGKTIKILNELNPEKLPWKKLGVDVVIESTGAFTDVREAGKHIKAGAKKVIISAICKGDGLIIVPGVNDYKLKKENVISLASCTTNCVAPIMKVLNDNFGVERAFLTTSHGYTSSQSLVDGSNKRIRRGRAAALNIVPTSTGAAEAVVKIIPELKGKFDGLALRVPVACGSISDIVAVVKKPVSVNKVNNAFKEASKKMKGIIEYSEEEIVSTDVIGNSHSAIIDSKLTQVNGNVVKIFAWYDNEYGYSNRLVDVSKKILK